MAAIALFLVIVCALVGALWVIGHPPPEPVDYAKRRREQENLRGYWG
jgi:hypothetical protein